MIITGSGDGREADGTGMAIRSRLMEGEFAVADIVREAAALVLRTPPAEPPPLPDDRRRILTGQFRGWLWMDEVQPGLVGSASDMESVSDATIAQTIDRSVMVAVLLQGRTGSFRPEAGEELPAEQGRARVTGFGEARRCVRRLHAGERGVRTGITVSPCFLEQFADVLPGRELDVLERLLAPGFRSVGLRRCELLSGLSRGLVAMPYGGSLGRLYRESAVTQILFRTLELLREEWPLVRALGRRQHDAVLRAQAVLDASLVSPPGTLDLARQVGLNRNTLQAGFRAVFGTTVFGYVRARRLAMARLLMEEQGLGAAEAGYRVGFASPSAFSAAYRRHFGETPTARGVRH